MLASALPSPAFGKAKPAPTGYTDTSPRKDYSVAPKFSYDDELILQIQTTQGEMADTMIAYAARTDTFLPLGAMARFLDMAIAISDDGHFAQGWFVNEKHRLTLNLRAHTLNVDGHDLPFGPGDAVAFEGELYLRAELYPLIFPLTLKTDLRAAMITVKTRVPFPFEEKLAREAQREKLASRQNGQHNGRHWPRESTPYAALSFPLVDAELRAASDSALGPRLESDVRLAGDLAFLTAHAYLSSNSLDGLTAARLELGRRDPDAHLLGPMKASEFQLGDISTTSLPMGLRSVSGRGGFVTNAPLERASVFDKIDLRGDLPEGYEVELYRNNILIDSTRTPVGGQYQFLQVSVDYGLNVIRLVFYGPQGQRREEIRRVSVGDGRLSPGELIYAMGAAQKDVSLVNVHGPNFLRSQDYGAWRSTALVQYGLTRGLTVALDGGWTQSDQGARWLAGLGLRTGLGGMAAKLDFGLQSTGGKAAEMALAGSFHGLTYTLTHAEYSGRFSDEVRAFTSDFLTRATELNLNTTLHLGGSSTAALPLSAQFSRIEDQSGLVQTTGALRTSLPFHGWLASHTFNYTESRSPGMTGVQQLGGSFDLASLTRSRTNWRGSLQYGVLPVAQIKSVSLEASHAIDDRTLLRAAVAQSFVNPQTSLGLSASRRFGRFTLAFDSSYTLQSRNYAATLHLGFSLGRNPLTSRVFLHEPGLASGGAVVIRAFADSNGTGQFDPRDALLPEVTFNTGSRTATTNAHGMALLGGLGDGTRTSFQVDADTLPDIAMAPATAGIEFVPRAGRIHVTNFAVQTLSEIEGSAYFDNASLNRRVSGLALRLVDAGGQQIARARTEADGYFLFERIRPGQYRLEIDPGQARNLKIHLQKVPEIRIGPKSSALRETLVVASD